MRDGSDNYFVPEPNDVVFVTIDKSSLIALQKERVQKDRMSVYELGSPLNSVALTPVSSMFQATKLTGSPRPNFGFKSKTEAVASPQGFLTKSPP